MRWKILVIALIAAVAFAAYLGFKQIGIEDHSAQENQACQPGSDTGVLEIFHNSP